MYVGMLSKSKGQILWLAAPIHVLFHWESPHNVPSDNSADAVKAAISFVDTCIQHVVYLIGKKDIQEEIDEFSQTLHRKYRFIS